MTYDEMKKILCAAGIRTTEAAILFGVKRQTIYNWVKKLPETLIVRRAEIVCKRINEETKKGTLPVNATTAEGRLSSLQKILFP